MCLERKMKKACKVVSAVIGRMLFIGFGMQIVLGICWMIYNFTGFQQFGESILYEEISKTLICDEYEGVLYPVLIMLARGIEGLIHIPYRYIIYLLQIGLAFVASVQLLKSVGIKGRFAQVFGSLSIVTFPMMMQCHLAVLPDSLVCSAVLAEIAWSVRIIQKGQFLLAKDYVKILGFWLVASLLQPTFLYVGAVPALFVFGYGFVKAWKHNKKVIVYNGILIAACLGVIGSVMNLTQAEGAYGRVHKSLNAAMASRCAWLFAWSDYEYWPEEVKENISFAQAREIEYYADNVDRILGRTLEESTDPETAEKLLGEIASIAWELHSQLILHYTAWDAVGYLCSPVVVQRQLTGDAYDSYSGTNYDIMREKTPVLTKYYMDYGCRMFVVGVVAATCIVLCRFAGGRRFRVDANHIVAALTVLCTVGLLVLLYTLRGAGMMDYKKSIAVTSLWIVGILIAAFGGEKDGEEQIC